MLKNKVLEKKCDEAMDKAAEIDDKIETMVEECKKNEKNVNFYRTCTKYVSKALIILGTIAVAHEYGLEMGGGGLRSSILHKSTNDV